MNWELVRTFLDPGKASNAKKIYCDDASAQANSPLDSIAPEDAICMLDDVGDSDNRLSALWSLMYHHEDQTENLSGIIQKVVAEDPDPKVRLAVLEALRSTVIKSCDREDRPLCACLARIVKDEERIYAERAAAFLALEQVAVPGRIAILKPKERRKQLFERRTALARKQSSFSFFHHTDWEFVESFLDGSEVR